MEIRIWLVVLFIPVMLLANESTEPLPVGNFSVPAATQIAPLISFGQLLIGKNALLLQFSGIYTRSHHGYTNVIIPNVTYGILDELAVCLFVPITPKSRKGASYASGIEDMILQLEYGYYRKTSKEYALEGTVVGTVQFPTGSSSKTPPTGTGSFSYLLGTTFAYQSYNWYAFVSPGIYLTMSHHGTKFGNSYLYQWGFARYIEKLSPRGWVFDLMVEFDGTYSEKDKIHGMIDPNSGGNVLIVTPSIWLSSQRWIFQWGMGIPTLQDLNGHQDKLLYTIAYILGIAFYF